MMRKFSRKPEKTGSASGKHTGPVCVSACDFRSCAARVVERRAVVRPLLVLLALLFVQLSGTPALAQILGAISRDTHWGETSAALLRHFGAQASALPRPIDFGDSFADVVLRNLAVADVRMIAFFQMDKRTRGLKRIQLERQRHGVSPRAFRAVLAALNTAYGAPDAMCGVSSGRASGYQPAAEYVWQRDGAVIRAIFRDTTIEAFEGCLLGDRALFGPCGLTGQLLIRISPPGSDAAHCPAPLSR